MARKYSAWLQPGPVTVRAQAPPPPPPASDTAIADILARSDREMRALAAEMSQGRLLAGQASRERWAKVSNSWLTPGAKP